ncbi:MAG: DUF364 domain-containing protein [Deltaproteobacteria bacterium]|nr:DUF364 domain-containing protein [Deltaproteobacteria bacterium]
MSLLEEIIASIEDDAPVSDIRICIRATAVVSKHLGLSYTFPKMHHGYTVEGQPANRRLSDMSARRLAEMSKSVDLLDAAVGLAAINSLLDADPESLKPGNALEVIIREGAGKNVTVVGHFPFVNRLKEQVKKLWVLELVPQEGDLPSSEASRVIPRSDVVAITGTALINHTLEDLLDMARDKYVVLLGPSTPASKVFFNYGVDAVCGSLVDDADAVLRGVSEGVSFRYLEGLKPFIMFKP